MKRLSGFLLREVVLLLVVLQNKRANEPQIPAGVWREDSAKLRVLLLPFGLLRYFHFSVLHSTHRAHPLFADPDSPVTRGPLMVFKPLAFVGRDRDVRLIQEIGGHNEHGRPCSDSGLPVFIKGHWIAE